MPCTCDGMVGESFYIGQVVVRTVLLQPLADILLSPQNHWFGQTGQCRAGVVDGEGFTRMQLKRGKNKRFIPVSVMCFNQLFIRCLSDFNFINITLKHCFLILPFVKLVIPYV